MRPPAATDTTRPGRRRHPVQSPPRTDWLRYSCTLTHRGQTHTHTRNANTNCIANLPCAPTRLIQLFTANGERVTVRTPGQEMALQHSTRNTHTKTAAIGALGSHGAQSKHTAPAVVAVSVADERWWPVSWPPPSPASAWLFMMCSDGRIDLINQ